MYADDIKICKVIDSPTNTDRMRTVIDFLSKWSECWELPLGVDKTQIFVIGNPG